MNQSDFLPSQFLIAYKFCVTVTVNYRLLVQELKCWTSKLNCWWCSSIVQFASTNPDHQNLQFWLVNFKVQCCVVRQPTWNLLYIHKTLLCVPGTLWGSENETTCSMALKISLYICTPGCMVARYVAALCILWTHNLPVWLPLSTETKENSILPFCCSATAILALIYSLRLHHWSCTSTKIWSPRNTSYEGLEQWTMNLHILIENQC